MKKCPSCKQTLTTASFGSNRSLPDGLSFYCRECNRERSRGNYREKREKLGFKLVERDTGPDGYERCSTCREVKPVTEFHRQKSQSRGFNTYGKECRKSTSADIYLRRTYGLSRADLDALVASQEGSSAICSTNSGEHVDHDHLSGKIRGVLCFTCNVALGQLKDDVALFRKAIDYLERTTWQRTLVSPGVYQLISPRQGAAALPTS